MFVRCLPLRCAEERSPEQMDCSRALVHLVGDTHDHVARSRCCGCISSSFSLPEFLSWPPSSLQMIHACRVRHQAAHAHMRGPIRTRISLNPPKCTQLRILARAWAGGSQHSWVDDQDIPRKMVAVHLAFLASLSLFVPVPATAETLSGIPKVVDGDTLELGKERIRLYGIDAPETKQLCKNSKGQDYACGMMQL
jgi:hypothetical protein